MKAASRPRRIYVVIEARIMNLDELDSETDRSLREAEEESHVS